MEETKPLLSLNASMDEIEEVGTATPKTNPQKEVHKNQLGTINGCYVPCLLNIMGIVLFMRLPWATGQAGLSGILAGIALAECMSLPTVLSLSAIVSNGNMEGGGSYFMISRSLGPELGGAIGILFYLAYAIGVAFYIIGFSSELQTSFPIFYECNCEINDAHVDYGLKRSCILPGTSIEGHCEMGKFFVSTPEWTVAIIGSFSLLVCLGISLKGAGFFARFNVVFFAVQMLATLWGIISFLTPQKHINPRGATVFNQTHGVTRFLHPYNAEFSFDNLRDNWESKWSRSEQCLNEKGHPSKCDFRLMYAIIFPMATGIMEGANLSGDQKNPAKAIPTGTLWAVFTSCCTYIVLVICFAGSFKRHVLINDLNVFQNASLFSPEFVIAGILISSLSSGLGSLFGGSRVLQAIARDNLYPILKPFAFGSSNGDEPRVAVLGTWVISQSCIMIGNLDVVAPIITSIFCMSYALVNLTCFTLALSGAPNFRPMFKYWSKWTALLGLITNIFVMFYLDYRHGMILCGILVILLIYLVARGPVTQWGDVSQALMFHQVRKYLLMLNQKPHPKFWRPNLLLLIDDPKLGVLGFCNSLKKGGILVTGHVIIGSLKERFEDVCSRRTLWQEANRRHQIKAFPHVTVAPSVRVGYQFLITCGGLGGLDVNTVVVPLLRGLMRSPSGESIRDLVSESAAETNEASSRQSQLRVRIGNGAHTSRDRSDSLRSDGGSLKVPFKDAVTYCSILCDAIVAQKNLIVTRNFGTGLSRRNSKWWVPSRQGHVTANDPNKTYIDLWVVDDWGFNGFQDDRERCDQTVMLLFQFGAILTHKLKDDKHKLRVLYVPSISCLDADEIPSWNPVQARGKPLEDGVAEYCTRIRVRPQTIQIVDPRHCGGAGTSEMDKKIVGQFFNENIGLASRARALNTLVSMYSQDTSQIFMTLPEPPDSAITGAASCGEYLEALDTLTDIADVPSALVYNGEQISFVSDGI